MLRRLFTVASAGSLALFLWLLVAPHFGNARRFWVSSPFGEVGPFDATHESDVGWVLLAFLVPPSLWVALTACRLAKAARRRRQLGRGFCPKCSYDLRATPDRCPECGSIFKVREPLTHNERAILELLLRDSLECGKVYHFDPGWVARELDLHDLELAVAARRLAALGLLSIHEFRSELTDIVVTAGAASFLLGSTSSSSAAPHG